MKKIKLTFAIVLSAVTGLTFGQCDAPTNLSASYSNNSTTFTWNSVSSANAYNLEIKQHDGLSWAYAEYSTTVNTNSLTIQGIMQSLTIDWRVQATCSAGSSAFTETQFTLPCPEATGLNVTNVTSTTAIMNWTPAAGYNTYISDFALAYRVYGINANWTSLGHTQNSSLSISNLQPNTTYEYCVNQTCPYFNSSPVFGTFTTANAVCHVPANLSSNSIGNSTAQLTWDASSGAINYTVELKPSTSSTWTAYSSSSNSFTANNLNMGTTYNFRVRSNCNGSASAFSNTSSFTTQNCASNGNNNQEWIRFFELGDISRTSGAESGGYVNTNSSTSLTIGSKRNAAKIRAGYSGSFTTKYFSIYIDFNQNGIYDNNELVYGPDDISNGNTYKFRLNIPSNINAVTTGMRVIMSKSNSISNGCLTGFYGETEDYTVNLVGGGNNLMLSTSEIEEIKGIKFEVYPNPSNTSIIVDLNNIENPLKVRLVNTFGQTLLEKSDIENAPLSLDLSSLNKGCYFVIVNDKKGNTYSQKIIKQ